MSSDTLQSLVSVLEFGAKGDGTTNDTAAIQSAIDHADRVRERHTYPAQQRRCDNDEGGTAWVVSHS